VDLPAVLVDLVQKVRLKDMLSPVMGNIVFTADLQVVQEVPALKAHLRDM
jgi:hypothetical protein